MENPPIETDVDETKVFFIGEIVGKSGVFCIKHFFQDKKRKLVLILLFQMVKEQPGAMEIEHFPLMKFIKHYMIIKTFDTAG